LERREQVPYQAGQFLRSQRPDRPGIGQSHAADLFEHTFDPLNGKPHIVIDDQPPSEWRLLRHIYPGVAASSTSAEYRRAVFGEE